MPCSIQRQPVHPRLCGEHFASVRHLQRGQASPPVRGTRHQPRRLRVHPRLCGEHRGLLLDLRLTLRFIPACAGNTLGFHRTTLPVRIRTRFIPACAGNTAFDGRERAPSAVHPRLCGEHPVQPTKRGKNACAGSSPPVRGTLFSQSTKK